MPQYYPLQSNFDQAGLTIILQRNHTDPSIWESCLEKALIIHPSNVLPSSYISSNFRLIEYGKTYDVTITPKITRSDEDLKKIDYDKRKCYFDDERNLKYFKTYSQKNCELECLSNFTYMMCDCVSWFMIRDSSMKICAERRIDRTIVSCSLKSEQYAFDSEIFQFNVKKICRCYPSCNEHSYHVKFQVRPHSR